MTNLASVVRILLALSAVALLATGCVTAKPTELEAGTATAAAPAPSSDSTSTSDSATTAAADDSSRAALAASIDALMSDSDGQPSQNNDGQPSQISRYIVQSGDHLWGISSQPQVYGDPYQWPLLFKRNRSEIEDADLIYPGQVLHIDRDANEHQIQQAIDHAKTRGAWSLGVTEASDLEYLAKVQSSHLIHHKEVEHAVARAGDDLNRARRAGAIWRLVDFSTGGSAVDLDELLRVADQKLETGDLDEAKRIALRVSQASILGIEQVQSQSWARPSYN